MKTVRLTESDLIRIVKKVISEQSVKGKDNLPTDQKKFHDYLMNTWFSGKKRYNMDQENTSDMYKLCSGPCQGGLGMDSDTVTWDFKTNQILGTKEVGFDPKPIPLNSSFNDTVKWFSSWYK